MTSANTTRHRRWILLFIGAMLFAFVSEELVASMSLRKKTELASLTAQRESLALRLQQWTDDAKSARTIREKISDDDIERLLAPTPREAMTARLEPLAAASRLVHVTFTLSEPRKWDGGDAFPDIEGVESSTLTLEADAPHDGDIFTFIDSFATLPGTFELKELSVTPLRPDNPDDIGPLNLHMKAMMIWIANAQEDQEKH